MSVYRMSESPIEISWNMQLEFCALIPGLKLPRGQSAKMTTTELDPLVAKLSKLFDTKKTKGQHGDVLFLLSELKKLLHTLPEPVLMANQEKLENLLYDHVMMQNGTLMISQLVAGCLVAIYERGKAKFRYSFLVDMFSHKDQDPRLGSLCVFGFLVRRFGAQFLENMNELVSTWSKVVKKDSIATKDAVLAAIVAMYEGMGGPSRQESETKDHILKLVAKLAADKSHAVRAAAANCMQSIVACVSDATLELDVFIPPVVKNLKDPEPPTRYRFADLLGQMLFLACQKAPQNPVEKKRKIASVNKKTHYDGTSLDSALATISRFFAKTSNPLTRVSLSFTLVALFQGLELDSDSLAKYVTVLFGFIAKGKPVSAEKFGRHSAYCLSHMLREGLLQRQRERGLEAAARHILTMIQQRTQKETVLVNEYQLLVCLEQLGFIFNRLGTWLESLDIKDLALEVLISLLADSNKIIRIHTAQCLRQLGRAVPSRMATWLSMLSKVVVSWCNSNNLAAADSTIEQAAFCSLHGHIYALAALVSVTSENPDGVPNKHLAELFNTADTLVSIPNGTEGGPFHLPRQLVKEAGWTLLSSLIGLGQEWVNSRLQRLIGLWKPLAKGPGTIAESALIHYLNLRLQSLVALRAFVCVYLPKLKEIKSNGVNQILRNVVVFTNTTFKLIKDKEKERGAAPDVHRAFTSLTAVLFDIYAALPPASFANNYAALLQFAVQEFTNQNARLNTEIDTLLTPADRPLEGPAAALGLFVALGDVDQCSLVNYAWNWCKRPDSFTHSQHPPTTAFEEKFYHYQPFQSVTDAKLLNSDEATLLSQDRSTNAAIRLFAAIFLEQEAKFQQQLTEHFLKVSKSKQVTPAIVSNVITVVLAVCREINQRKQKIDCSQSVETILQICGELMGYATPHVRRAVGESLGLLCRVEDEGFIGKVFTLIKSNLESSKQPNLMAGAAFALGCVIRYAGAMRTIKYQTFTVAALHTLGLDFTDPFRLWVLHTLWISVDTAGVSFATYMQPTLAIITGQCQHDAYPRPDSISQAIARVLHAVLAAMGPELGSPSPAILQFLNIWQLIKTDPCSSVQVEIVNAMQQLMMWSSPALDLASFFQVLNQNSSSTDASLRRAVVRCARGWAEKDSTAFFRVGLDAMLLRMLDAESEPDLIDQIQRAYSDCIEFVLLSNQSSNWTLECEVPVWQILDICKRVVVPQKLPSDATFKVEKQMEAKTKAKEEKEGDEDDVQTVEIERVEGEKFDSRAETKVFAVSCIQQIVQSLRTTGRPEHFDLAYAKKRCEGKPRLLVQQVNDLVTVAGMAVTSPYLPLQVVGLKLLRVIINAFEKTIDPDGEGSVILELYQAQITSALRQTLSPPKDDNVSAATSPRLRLAACEAAVAFILSGALVDTVALGRIIGLLMVPLEKPDTIAWTTDLFNDKVFTQVSLAHIRALALLDLASFDPPVEEKKSKGFPHPKLKVLKFIKDDFVGRRALLCKFYFKALKDYAVVCALNRSQAAKIKGNFFDGTITSSLREVYNSDSLSLLDICSRLVRFLPNNKPEPVEAKSSDVVTLQEAFLYLLTAVMKLIGTIPDKIASELEEHDRQVLATCYQVLANLASPEFVASGVLTAPTMSLMVDMLACRLDRSPQDQAAWEALKALVLAGKSAGADERPQRLVRIVAEFCCGTLQSYFEQSMPAASCPRVLDILQLLPPLYQLSMDCKDEQDYFSPFVLVCLQCQRTGDETVGQRGLVALVGLITLYFTQPTSTAACEQITSRLSDELNQALKATPSLPQFRVQSLLSSLLLLVQGCNLGSPAQASCLSTVMAYCEHPDFSRLSLQILFKVLLTSTAASRSFDLTSLALRRVTPLLAKLVRYPSEEETSKLEALTLAVSTFSIDARLHDWLLPLWVPLFITRLPHAEVLSRVLGLGQQVGAPFKAQVQRLTPQQRNTLQSAVVAMQAQQGAQRQQPANAEATKKEKKKAEKESLTINFAKFT